MARAAHDVASARQLSAKASWLLLLPVLVLLVGVFFAPVAELFSLSLFDPVLTTEHYSMVFSEPLFLRVMRRTMQISFVVALLAVVLGFPIAFVMSQAKGMLPVVIGVCVLVPLWTSVLVRSYAWVVILQSNGLLNQWMISLGLIERPMRLIYTDGAVVIAMVQVLLPFAILPLYASLKTIPDDLFKAASVSGAGPASIFRHVVLPLSLPGVGAGFALVFIQSLGFFVTPALVGGPQSLMIATLISQEIRSGTSWALACALAVVLLITTLMLMAAFNRLLRLDKITGEGR